MNVLKQLKNLATDTMSSSSGSMEKWYITAERAEGIKDTDRFSKSDPYLKIKFGGKNVRTRTINNDRSPAWNETFDFKLSSGHATDIVLQLVDDDVGLDDTIGTATISRGDLPTNSGEEKFLKVPVLRKEQISGVIHLRVKKIVDGASSSYSSSTQQSSYPQQQYQQQHQQQQYQQPQHQQSHQMSSQPYYGQGSQQQQSMQPSYNSSQQSYYQTQAPPSYPQYQGQGQGQSMNMSQPPMMTNQSQPSYQGYQQPQTQYNPNPNSNSNYYGRH